jgi:RNA polymerase sigma factor (sigma-70 family)
MTKRMQMTKYGEELSSFQEFQRMAGEETDPQLRKRLFRVMRQILLKDLTPRQRQMMEMHYFQNLTMTEIALRLGVNKSTVSRCISRGRSRMELYMKYLFEH